MRKDNGLDLFLALRVCQIYRMSLAFTALKLFETFGSSLYFLINKVRQIFAFDIANRVLSLSENPKFIPVGLKAGYRGLL